MRRKTIIALTLVFLFTISGRGGAAAETKEVRIAIMALENLNQDPALDELKVGIAEPLSVGLEDKDWITVVERTQLDKVFKEQALAQTGLISSATAAQVGKALGANWLLLGSYFVWEKKIRIMIKFVDVETGQIDTSKFISIEGNSDDVLSLVTTLIEKIDTTLKAGLFKKEGIKPLRIAILPFMNVSKKKEYEAIGHSTSEILHNALPKSPEISVVERAQMEKLVAEMSLGQTGFIDPQTAVKIGKLHGASVLLLGSFMVFKDKIQLIAKFVNTETGEIGVIKSAVVRGETKDLFSLQDKLVDTVRESVMKKK